VSTTDTTPATDPAVTEPETDDTSVNELAGEDLVGGGNGEVLASGWFDDTGAWPHIILWGLLLAGVALGINLGGRRLGRRWLGVAIGAAPFLVVLYFFFQNVNRLLPPGL
jgi:sortase A